MENEREQVDVNIRKCKYDVRQAYLKWGTNAGEKVLGFVKDNKWTEKITIIHSVMPRSKRDDSKADSINMPFESRYIEESQKHLLSEGGYDEFPYFVPRQIKVSGEVWGYSQSMIALPDVKTLNSMSKTILKSAQKMVDPPIVVPNEGYILPFRTTAGAINFKEAGNQDTIDVIGAEVKGNIPIGLEMEEQRRNQIRRSMFVDLFMTLAKLDKEMTAREVIERVNEKMLILGPILGRLMHELLDPLIHRTFSILLKRGKIPPVPQILLNQDGSTKNYTIVYISPLAKAQRLAEAKSINDFLVTISAIGNVIPTVYDVIDADKIVKRLANIYNCPPDFLNSDEAIQGMREQRAQVQQMQQQLEMANLGMDSVEKGAKAEKNLKQSKEVKSG
jgi:hypothetical protein